MNGAVRNPGLFTVDPTMSVGDAIGLAGGVSPEGRNGRVDLVRDGRRIATSISPSSRLVELALRSGDELNVPERAWALAKHGIAVRWPVRTRVAVLGVKPLTDIRFRCRPA